MESHLDAKAPILNIWRASPEEEEEGAPLPLSLRDEGGGDYVCVGLCMVVCFIPHGMQGREAH